MATQSRLPTGDGDTDYPGLMTPVPSSPSTLYDKVDDPVGSPDDSSTYLSFNTYYHWQLFTFSAFSVPSGAVISKVTLNLRIYGWQYPIIKVNGSVYIVGCDTSNAQNVWATTSQDWTTNPATSVAWNVSDVNGTGTYPLQQFGTESWSPTSYITQCYLTVEYAAFSQYGIGIAGVGSGWTTSDTSASYGSA
jgi:hypothetical protein